VIAAWPAPPVVIWHDVECGAYRADLPLWRELAAQAPGPVLDHRAQARVLDVGAGTGRVALDLARAGFAVTALDREPARLDALAERAAAAGLSVDTVLADAQAFDLGAARFELVAVPMQTIQLLPDRPAFLRAARRHLATGGLVALATADELEGFAEDTAPGLPAPDVSERDGWRFASQPVGVAELGDRARIERVRRACSPAGEETIERDVIELEAVPPAVLHAEGAAAGLRPEPERAIPATREHVGSRVVLLRG
jgi:SAM-dependent methyltransferase